MKQQFHLLRDEMTVQQALSVLGLAPYRGRLFEMSAGSGGSGGITLMLAEGHRFILSYQYVRDSTRVMEAHLDEQSWRASDAH